MKNIKIIIMFIVFISFDSSFSKIREIVNINYLENCTASTPFDLYNAGSPSFVLCGGNLGVDVSNIEAVMILINYTSTDTTTGIECSPQFSDRDFIDTIGSTLWTDAVTHSTSQGIVSLSKMKIRLDNQTSSIFTYFLPTSYERFRLKCKAANLDGAISPWTGIVASGDTLSVAIRGVSYE